MIGSCTPKADEIQIVSKLADVKLIGWDNSRVSDDAKIVSYAGKPFLKVAARDVAAEAAVASYCKWKGSTGLLLPVKTAVGERIVEDWRAIALPSGEVFIAGGAFQKPSGVIDQTWLLEPKTSRLRDGPQMLRARRACTLTMLSSGKVLISGGQDTATEPINECECFDGKKEANSKFTALATPRVGHAVIELKDGNLLVIGGRTAAAKADSPGRLTSSIEIWDKDENDFFVIGKTRKARYQPQLFLIDPRTVLIAKGHMFAGDVETLEAPPAEIYMEVTASR